MIMFGAVNNSIAAEQSHWGAGNEQPQNTLLDQPG